MQSRSRGSPLPWSSTHQTSSAPPKRPECFEQKVGEDVRKKKHAQRATGEPESNIEGLNEEAAVDLPNREVMTLIDPNMLGGGLGGGLLGGTSPTGGTSGTPTDPTAVPQPGTSGATPGTVPSTGLGALDKFMPSTNTGQPYDPTVSTTNQS